MTHQERGHRRRVAEGAELEGLLVDVDDQRAAVELAGPPLVIT